MTLGRLLLAWLPVAALFVLTPPIASRGDAPAGASYFAWPFNRREIGWRLVEAAVVTLLASLWFDSLGSGGWWLLFLLVGALATIPTWLRTGPVQPPRRTLLVGTCADLARYVLAGAILAWRLS